MSPFPAISKLKRFLNIWNERKYKQAIATVNQFAMDAVKSKETQNIDEKGDLLSRFTVLTYGMERNENSRREFLRDNIISFIFAGKDLTSIALTWFFWLLDGHSHCKNLIRKELATLTLNRPLYLTFDDLKSLNYLHAALSESMRLFPPVPVISKSALDDDVLPDGTFVGEGWFADCSVYAMGRMERIWGSDCREFKPERWLDGNGVYKRLDPFKYPVFGCGYRSCFGREMVYVQMKLVVVAVMNEFEIEVVGGGGTPEKVVDPPYRVATVLSMKKGLHARLKKREQTQQQSYGARVQDGGVIMALFGLFLVGLSLYKRKLYTTRG
ncbi:hypothetical protein SSX86_012200 [Deinandra increscens subsp. villosa]|uniref:Cytochrome P450 n=1 Tax=Deinandra increscens subsp. villosa TaxID=3103831 RepID=A0AAP0D469_9ASTR